MLTNKLTLGLSLIAVFAAGLACSFLTGLGEPGGDLVSTAQNAATQAVGLATALDEQGLNETAVAFATEFGETGIGATAEAMITAINPTDVVATAQAFGTQAASEGGESLATVQAMATQFAESSGDLPEDIPVPDGEKTGFVAMGNLVSFGIQQPFDEVLAYYQNEMPANGWEEAETGNLVADSAAVLVFEKINRTATITLGVIPLAEETRVQILIVPEAE